jgi:hypothetical protein
MKPTLVISLFVAILVSCVVGVSAWLNYADYKINYHNLVREGAVLDGMMIQKRLDVFIGSEQQQFSAGSVETLMKELNLPLSGKQSVRIINDDQMFVLFDTKNLNANVDLFQKNTEKGLFIYAQPLRLAADADRKWLVLNISRVDYDQNLKGFYDRLIQIVIGLVVFSFLVSVSVGSLFIRPVRTHFHVLTERLCAVLSKGVETSNLPPSSDDEGVHYLEFEKETKRLLEVLDDIDDTAPALKPSETLSRIPTP